MRPSTTFVAGLTGGVGSGKSTAAELFARLGAYVIDADAISHALTGRGGAAIAAIDAAFPGVVRDGVLDRASLRERVFADAAERHRLEAIVHPLVRVATDAEMHSPEAARAPYVVHMVPLLFESKDFAKRVDCALLVDEVHGLKHFAAESFRDRATGVEPALLPYIGGFYSGAEGDWAEFRPDLLLGDTRFLDAAR